MKLILTSMHSNVLQCLLAQKHVELVDAMQMNGKGPGSVYQLNCCPELSVGSFPQCCLMAASAGPDTRHHKDTQVSPITNQLICQPHKYPHTPTAFLHQVLQQPATPLSTNPACVYNIEPCHVGSGEENKSQNHLNYNLGLRVTFLFDGGNLGGRPPTQKHKQSF